MSDAVLDLAAAVVRMLGGVALLYMPGLALCYWLYPRRGLDPLERAYLAALASLGLLTLIGVGLLELEGSLDPRALAYWSVACSVACVVVRGGGAILTRQQARGGRPAGRSKASGRTKRGGARGAHRGAGHPNGSVRHTVRVRGARGRIPTRFGARCYPTRVRSVRSERRRPPGSRRTGRTSGSRFPTSEVLRSWGRWALPRGALLGVVVLTLLAYRGCAPRWAAWGGPVVAFSIPAERLVAAQAALREGGSVAIPFRVENLGGSDGGYRVEAWGAARVGETPYIWVAAGARYHGEVEVRLPGVREGGPLDLYLYPAQAGVPLAHLRLWAAE
jgi:hypothetical protein